MFPLVLLIKCFVVNHLCTVCLIVRVDIDLIHLCSAIWWSCCIANCLEYWQVDISHFPWHLVSNINNGFLFLSNVNHLCVVAEFIVDLIHRAPLFHRLMMRPWCIATSLFQKAAFFLSLDDTLFDLQIPKLRGKNDIHFHFPSDVLHMLMEKYYES